MERHGGRALARGQAALFERRGEAHWAAVVALLVVQVLFGAFPVGAKFALEELPPLALACIRVFFAALLLVALQRAIVGENVARRDVPRLAGLGLLGVVFNQVLFIEGLHRTTAINAVVIIAVLPILTMVVALLLRKEPLRRGKLLGIAFSFTGILVLVGIDRLDLGAQNTVGNLMVLGNALSYACFLVLSKPLLSRYHPLTVTAWSFLLGSLFILPLAVPDLIRLDWEAVPAPIWGLMVLIILGPSVATYWLNTFALVRLEASTVAFYIYLQPLVTAILAVPLLHEELGERTLAAALLIFAGVAIATGRRPLARRVPSEVPVAETKTFRDEPAQ